MGVGTEERQLRLGRAAGRSAGRPPIVAVVDLNDRQRSTIDLARRPNPSPQCRSSRPSGRRTRTRPSAGSEISSTDDTSACPGPRRTNSTIAATASAGPSNTASAVPSAQLRAHPATPRRAASRRTESRKKTPCTRPCARTRMRSIGHVDTVTRTPSCPTFSKSSRRWAASPRRRRPRRGCARSSWPPSSTAPRSSRSRARATARPSRWRSPRPATSCSPPPRRRRTSAPTPRRRGSARGCWSPP